MTCMFVHVSDITRRNYMMITIIVIPVFQDPIFYLSRMNRQPAETKNKQTTCKLLSWCKARDFFLAEVKLSLSLLKFKLQLRKIKIKGYELIFIFILISSCMWITSNSPC